MPPSPSANDAGELARLIRTAAEPLPDIGSPDFARHFDRYGASRVVLLGEASHGTSEFYRARAAITRRLVTEHGFTVIAVEADWPDAAAIDRYIRNRPAPAGAGTPFARFPQWMWRNTDMLEMIAWLRHHNDRIASPERQAGFYGLDLYNMGASIAAVLRYLDRTDAEAARIARSRYGCLTPWEKNPSAYGRDVLYGDYDKCEEEVVAQCRELQRRTLDTGDVWDGLFDAQQNARLVAAAERYYRIMYRGGPDSWNLRDRHMFETLRDLLDARGPEAKAVVWAHNSHIGDARHTEMGTRLGELSIGQLCRQHFGDEASLIGFGTHTGTVAAASQWDGGMQVMRVNPSCAESHERLCHDAGPPRFLLHLRGDTGVADALGAPRLERFIGVIYRPESEMVSHYMEASLARQFDAFVWFDETSAVTPLGPEHMGPDVPDTFPFGL